MKDEAGSPVQPGLNALLEQERKLIRNRRVAAGDLRSDPAGDAVGIALSGGGIRSATFCLGVFQGLARKHLLGKLDYISSVSGGGYFASFFGRMFTRKWLRDPASLNLDPAEEDGLRSHRPEAIRQFVETLSSPGPSSSSSPVVSGSSGQPGKGRAGVAVRNAESVLTNNQSPPLRWLREGGNYLTPGGSGDSALAAAVFTRNWTAVLVVWLVTLLTLLLGGNLTRATLQSWGHFHEYEVWLQSLTAEHWWWTPWFFIPWLVLVLAVVPLAWAYWLTQAADNRQFLCVSLANLSVIGFGALAWRLLPRSSFYWISVGLGAEAFLALIWIWVMGAIRCKQSRDPRILPDQAMVVSILLVCLLPAVWRGLLWWQWKSHADLRLWIWLAAGLLVLAGLHHLALRAASESKQARASIGWRGQWNVSQWMVKMPGLVAGIGAFCLVPLLCTAGLDLWPSWWRQRANLWRLLEVWALLSTLSAFYFLAYQVLRRDELIRRQGRLKRPLLSQWLRSKLSRRLTLALIIYGSLQGLVIINACGQSIYAVVTYSGGTRSAAAAIAGLLGVATLAPLARAVAVRVGGGQGFFRVPLRLMALGGALVLALLLALSASYVSHGIAWRWGCPVLVEGEPLPGLRARLEQEWSRGQEPRRGVAAMPSTNTLAVTSRALNASAGAHLYRRYLQRRDVELTRERLVQVNEPGPDNDPFQPQPAMFLLDLGLSFVVTAALTLFFGGTISFLNLSSFHSFYTSRLVRAYQGATNDRRWRSHSDINEVDHEDDTSWDNYRPHEYGGPLHLVNMALNSTVSLVTEMESTTAKGLNLCLGPAGLSYGRRHALGCVRADEKSTPTALGVPPRDWVWLPDSSGTQPPASGSAGAGEFDRRDCKAVEPLSLGTWVGISGAAFTTGLGNVGGGAGTSIGTSLLCGLFNVRLGYWWENQFSPSRRISVDRNFSVQRYLADEFTGRFQLEQRNRWYLSDGGHFENTAAYELIRRRLPFIILCDCGADPGGKFDDIANLVRRVRLDFGAEISFLNDAGLKGLVPDGLLAPVVAWRARAAERAADPEPEPAPRAGAIGLLDDLRPLGEPGQPLRVRAHATLAWVRYPHAPEAPAPSSLLLLIKPGITSDLPADLLNYQRINPDFPHQTTLDQFFDEAQWESYRKLGEELALRLFADTDGQPWAPQRMARPQLP